MTQGYGPQQPWGQDGQPQNQNPPPAPPQWQPQPAPQSPPQWGQATPPSEYPGSPGQASPPSGYPGAPGMGASGAAGGAPFVPAQPVAWGRVKTLGITLLVAAALLTLVRLGADLASLLMAENLADESLEPGAAAIGGSIATILLFLGNILLSLIVMGVGIAAAVMGRGAARVGGIVAAASIPVSVVLYWILSFVLGIIIAAMAMNSGASAEVTAGDFRLLAGVDLLRVLFMGAVMLYASYLVFSTAKKKLSA